MYEISELVPYEKLPIKLAEAFGKFAERKTHASFVLFSAADWFLFALAQRDLFDRETQRVLIDEGTMGYLWGATLAIDNLVPKGTVYVSSAEREAIFSKKDRLLALSVALAV